MTIRFILFICMLQWPKDNVELSVSVREGGKKIHFYQNDIVLWCQFQF